MSRKNLIFFFLLLALSSFLAYADMRPRQVDDTFLVNTITSGAQTFPAIDVDSSGDFVIVWLNGNFSSLSTRMRGQRFSSSGDKVGSEFLIRDNNRILNWPALTFREDGTFLIAWEESNFTESQEIFAQIWDASGPMGEPFSPFAGENGSHLAPRVGTTPDGLFWVGTQRRIGDPSIRGPWARVVDSQGIPVGDSFPVFNTDQGSLQREADIDFSPTGEAVATWRSDSLGIRAQRFNASQEKIGPEIAVGPVQGPFVSRPRVSVAEDRSFVVTWHALDVLARRFSAEGAPLGGEFQVNPVPVGDHLFPDIDHAANGEFVIAWNRERNYAEMQLVGQRYSASASPQGRVFEINGGKTLMASPPDLRFVPQEDDPGYDFIVTWSSQPEGTNDFEIMASFFRLPAEQISEDGFESGDFQGWSSHEPGGP